MNDVNPRRCPLCQNENSCEVAAGRGDCWCFSKLIPDHVLEKIPPEARERACVCQQCAFGDRSASAVMRLVQQILKRRNEG